ncbi:uncharacterized protein A4U43_C10F18380 [Asparagus officinalis]|uniref:Shugoshin C-terminal domain-containing protein n=1 Tax=Asparagus officinalis TaxID=4686 RepID=A0A5P1E5L8_ASPOF|nr:SHUGOSHIN 2-like isoform X2 [Asparagus officinalis]ONK57273.1 uncharacterized protein A4U43_C10F18380 [Asparagus officinalis]
MDPGSEIRRKRFSDITNITSDRRSESNGKENPNGGSTKSAKDCITMLLKGNNLLLRLVDERNKIIEITGLELQKLKMSVEKVNQQNWELAQAHTNMLQELNLGKDRLKAMQHELGCTVAVLGAKTSELQELKKLNKQYKTFVEKIDSEPNKVVVDPTYPINCKKPANTNKKRTRRSQSLGPTRQETVKEKDEGRRKSLRRACNMKPKLLEPTEDSLEIEELKLPNYTNEDRNTVDDSPIHKIHCDQSISRKNVNLGSPRSSIGRPMRKAAEKVNSYKEVPINTKMRRDA